MFLTFKKTKFKICQKLNFSLEPARLFSENLEVAVLRQKNETHIGFTRDHSFST